MVSARLPVLACAGCTVSLIQASVEMLLTGISELPSSFHDFALSGEVNRIRLGEVGGLSVCMLNLPHGSMHQRFVIFACSVVIAAGASEVTSPILGGLAYEAKMERCVQAVKANGIRADANPLSSCKNGFYIGKFDH